MKRPFSNYLKLLYKFLSTDKFNKKSDSSDITDTYTKIYESTRIKITEKQTTYLERRRRYKTKYSTGELYFYGTVCNVKLNTFGKSGYELTVPLDINGKDEFFNYIMQHNVDYLTYEDIEVLKQIKNLTIKITQKETING